MYFTSLVLVSAGGAREARAARRRVLPAGCTQRQLHTHTHHARTILHYTEATDMSKHEFE